MLRLGGHFVSARYFTDRQPVTRLGELRRQFVEQTLDAIHRLRERRGHLLRGERLVSDVNNCFQNRLELRVFAGMGALLSQLRYVHLFHRVQLYPSSMTAIACSEEKAASNPLRRFNP